jgi:hypothetical protein
LYMEKWQVSVIAKFINFTWALKFCTVPTRLPFGATEGRLFKVWRDGTASSCGIPWTSGKAWRRNTAAALETRDKRGLRSVLDTDPSTCMLKALSIMQCWDLGLEFIIFSFMFFYFIWHLKFMDIYSFYFYKHVYYMQCPGKCIVSSIFSI